MDKQRKESSVVNDTPQNEAKKEEEDEEPVKLTLAQKMVSWMGYKSDEHKYVTNVIADHGELFNRPHTLQMYAESYKMVNSNSKLFCSEIAMLRW